VPITDHNTLFMRTIVKIVTLLSTQKLIRPISANSLRNTEKQLVEC